MPQPVPIGVVEALREKITDAGLLAFEPTLLVGQQTRIVDGPFADLIGTLEYLDGTGRVRVLLNLLGRPVSVALRSEAIASAT
jgi:transcriptional antiterminator RfaH